MDIVNTYFITIDKCIHNCKKYYFRSTIFFTNAFKVWNKKGNFLFTLRRKKSKIDKYIYYKLTIHKKVNFLEKNGWDSPLLLWYPIQLPIRQLNINTITMFFPLKTGMYDLQGDLNHDPYIGLLVVFNDNYEGVKEFLNSIRLLDMSGSLIVFLDNSLTGMLEEDNYNVHSIVEHFQLKCKNTLLIKVYKAKYQSDKESILLGMDFLSFFSNKLLVIDSTKRIKRNYKNKALHRESYINSMRYS
tara:strand:+ start:3737 stop:4468 length:732 start_codon:yes stop_codon:yes gene_type:complete